MDWNLRILENPEEMSEVEALQKIVWQSSDLDVIPGHLLLAIAHNGGVVIGAYAGQKLIGFVCGFPALEANQGERKLKHASHELGVHPDYQGRGLGFALKRAQWQMVRHQEIEHVTWTYDPLLSQNANLNISKLGGVCNIYLRDYYGQMRDGLNAGIPSDRFVVDWWVITRRVENRLSRKARRQLDLAHYLAAGVYIVNPTRLEASGLPLPYELQPGYLWSDQIPMGSDSDSDAGNLFLVEIPENFQALRNTDAELARVWRAHTRELFEEAFKREYLVTDFLHLKGPQARNFYVLSKGDITLGGDRLA